MKFISVRDLRSNSAKVWKALNDLNEMVITSNGKPIAILSSTSEDLLEASLLAIRKARAMTAVQSLQKKSVQNQLDQLTEVDINKEIEAVRKKRFR